MNLQDENFKKEMDQHIGVSPLVTNNDSDRFNEWLKQPQVKKQKRYLIPKMLTIILFLGIAYVVYDVLQSNNSSFLFTGSKHSTGDNLTKPWEIGDNLHVLIDEKHKDGYTLTILNNSAHDLNNNSIKIYKKNKERSKNTFAYEEFDIILTQEKFDLKSKGSKKVKVNIPFADNHNFILEVYSGRNVKENRVTMQGPLSVRDYEIKN